ncbi:MAG: aspartyl protease family protein [Acidobacteriaceae bacterium]|nr:aspartyl protease family protein [Acidobacteriaceae bacterium]
MRWSLVKIVLAAALLTAFPAFPQDDNGLAAYKSGNFEAAIPLLQNAAAKTPGDPILQAALLSSLIYEGRVDQGSDVDERDATAFPNSPEVIAARGEFAFYMADMPQAERLFRAALKLNEATPRAVYGLSRLYRAASFYRSARLLCLRAHVIDPDDALITQAFLRYVPASKRQELLAPFAAAHPWLYQHFEQIQENSSTLEAAIADKKLFETEGGPQETILKFFLLMRDAQRARGVGLDLKIGDGRPLKMLFDTGASGILVKQTAIDKAGLAHLGSDKAWGVGDGGTRNMFSAIANNCQVGPLKFSNCLVRALEGKRAIAGDEDGLIGADFFQDYLVDIDFQKRLLHLKPLPPRSQDPQGNNRVVAPDEKDFTPVFRFGHMLMVSTTVNRRRTGLFLLDTGSEASNIDSIFARLSTKIYGNDQLHVKGISGQVKNVYEAGKAELQFGRFRQDNMGIISYDLNNSPEHKEIRLSGILGIPVLSLFRLTIDYRNGLVNFDYVLK